MLNKTTKKTITRNNIPTSKAKRPIIIEHRTPTVEIIVTKNKELNIIKTVS